MLRFTGSHPLSQRAVQGFPGGPNGIPGGKGPACQCITNSQSSPRLMSIESVMSSSHLILCHPLLLLPSIFPSIRAVPDSLPATPKSPPTRRVPPRGTPRVPAHCRQQSFAPAPVLSHLCDLAPWCFARCLDSRHPLHSPPLLPGAALPSVSSSCSASCFLRDPHHGIIRTWNYSVFTPDGLNPVLGATPGEGQQCLHPGLTFATRDPRLTFGGSSSPEGLTLGPPF